MTDPIAADGHRAAAETTTETAPLREELKRHLISDLSLDCMDPAAIGDDTPLFGPEGLGLDSLDAVELVVLVQRRYGLEIENIDEARAIFASVNSLAGYIAMRRARS